MKHNVNDLMKVKNGDMSLDEYAEKYDVAIKNIYSVMSYYKIYTRKKKIKITTPYRITIVESLEECSQTLKLSRPTIKKALNGERVPILEQLNIKLEVIDNGEKKSRLNGD